MRSSPSPERATSLGPRAAAVVDPLASSCERHPHAVHAETGEQLLAQLDGEVAGADVEELLRRKQHAVEQLLVGARQRAQVGDLVLTQREAGLRKQTRHRRDRGAQAADLRVAGVAVGDPPRRVHRVEPAGTDLVRPRQHGDGVDRRGGSDGAIHERVEEGDVGGVDVAHQVDHGVGVAAGALLGVEELAGATRVLVVERGDARRVDQRQRVERGRRPAHVEPAHVTLGEAAELDVERAFVALERQRLVASVAQLGADLVARAAAATRNRRSVEASAAPTSRHSLWLEGSPSRWSFMRCSAASPRPRNGRRRGA